MQAKRTDPSGLFFRWLCLVYLPLALVALLALLFVLQLLPGWGTALLVILAVYALIPIRLLRERRRSGLGVPAPKSIVFGVATVSGLAVFGIGLFILGMERLTSSGGLAMALVGGFLMILSVTVPTFRLVDLGLKMAGRLIGKSGNAGRAAPSPEKHPESSVEDESLPPRVRPIERKPSAAARTPVRSARSSRSGKHRR